MAHLNTSARVSRQPRLRTDEAQTVVMALGHFWSVTGEFSTPGIGATPAFVATAIRRVNDDGSETPDMLEILHPNCVTAIEEQAVESLEEGRAEARAEIQQSYCEQDLCDVIDAARSVA